MHEREHEVNNLFKHLNRGTMYSFEFTSEETSDRHGSAISYSVFPFAEDLYVVVYDDSTELVFEVTKGNIPFFKQLIADVEIVLGSGDLTDKFPHLHTRGVTLVSDNERDPHRDGMQYKVVPHLRIASLRVIDHELGDIVGVEINEDILRMLQQMIKDAEVLFKGEGCIGTDHKD
ncbi:hypothetical protein Goe7_c00200 [Bacillus phage vB_BveM-Goe7]|nr:hypothetical protein Goe7_c00200 [Bacillus phage vB_BveM-Goe7]